MVLLPDLRKKTIQSDTAHAMPRFSRVVSRLQAGNPRQYRRANHLCRRIRTSGCFLITPFHGGCMPFPLHTRSNIGNPARAAVREQQKPPHNVQGLCLQFRRFSAILRVRCCRASGRRLSLAPERGRCYGISHNACSDTCTYRAYFKQ